MTERRSAAADPQPGRAGRGAPLGAQTSLRSAALWAPLGVALLVASAASDRVGALQVGLLLAVVAGLWQVVRSRAGHGLSARVPIVLVVPLSVLGAVQMPTLPAVEPPPPAAATTGLWLSHEEVMALPTSGAGWEQVRADATGDWGDADISDQKSDHDVKTLAGALYATRTGDDAMRAQVTRAIEDAVGTEDGGRTLALGRNLVSYVIAADLVGYRTPAFEDWLREVRHDELDGRTLVSTHEDRPNNWGAHAGASRIAAARYLGDTADLEAAADVFRGYVGERNVYDDFDFEGRKWQADPDAPVGINPPGATRDGVDVDGVLPDDQRRCGCNLDESPKEADYVWEALQGLTVQARLLERAGHPAWAWGDRALFRAVRWLEDAELPAEGDDTWVPALVNDAYQTSFDGEKAPQIGKNMGYTTWITKG